MNSKIYNSVSLCYDYGMDAALIGLDFEARAEQLALGATCSDRFVERYDALERGYAEGMRLSARAERLYECSRNYLGTL